MKQQKKGIFELVFLYFPALVLLFQGVKAAYEKYQDIKAANEVPQQTIVPAATAATEPENVNV